MQKILDKLYKRSETGSIRVWYAEIEGRKYRLHSGQLDGATVTSDWTLCTGKNKGRRNETTDEEQCKIEVEALYTKKLKRGYAREKGAVDKVKEEMIKPMLAHRYEDHSYKLNWDKPKYSQPKLDGVRAIGREDGLWSRKGEKIETVKHIIEPITKLARRHDVIFDGELYNHELRQDFNSITSLVRRQKQDPDHAKRVRTLVEYHVYDLIVPDLPFVKRFSLLQDILSELPFDFKMVKAVDTARVMNTLELDTLYGKYLEDGYEGQMVRVNTQYQHKRTDVLLKRKEFQDEEFEIVDFEEGRGNRSGMVGAVVLKLDKKRCFNAALMGTNDYRETIWLHRDQYVGMQATVKYFHKTPDGVPRFPVVKSIQKA